MAVDQVTGATRAALLQEYSDKKLLFRATTRPYKSRLPFTFSVTNPIGGATPTVAFAVLRSGQEREFFSFAVGQSVPFTNGSTKIATDSDTNQSNARNTNGIEDFVIESISCSCSGVRAQYADADAQVIALGLSDDDVIAAFRGQREIVDPAALLAPPQAVSPFNLESPMFEGLKPNTALEFQWDRTGIIPIGTLDQIPEGGAKSYLRASGVPDTANRYRVPEGYAWRQKARPDGDFVARATVTDAVVVPLNLIAPAGVGNTNSVPTFLYLDVEMRVHGLGLSQIGQNA